MTPDPPTPRPPTPAPATPDPAPRPRPGSGSPTPAAPTPAARPRPPDPGPDRPPDPGPDPGARRPGSAPRPRPRDPGSGLPTPPRIRPPTRPRTGADRGGPGRTGRSRSPIPTRVPTGLERTTRFEDDNGFQFAKLDSVGVRGLAAVAVAGAVVLCSAAGRVRAGRPGPAGAAPPAPPPAAGCAWSRPPRRSPTSRAPSAATGSSVTQILKPNVDPHDYEASPADLARDRPSRRWWSRTASAWRRGSTTRSRSAGYERRRGRHQHGRARPAGQRRDEEQRPATRTSGTTRATPRSWPTTSRPRFAAEDPARQGGLRAQRSGVRRPGCTRSTRGSRREIDTLPAGQRKLVTNHDAFGYYVARYGLQFVGLDHPELRHLGRAVRQATSPSWSARSGRPG